MSGRGVARNVRLKSDNSLVATYKYDTAGNRVEKAVNGGATERYVLSRAEQTSMGIDCWHVIATFDGSNNWKQNFVYRDEIDGVVALEQKDVLDFDTDGNTTEITRNFCHGNALGSVMAISDMTQATAVSYRYDPYGKVTITRGGQTQTSDPLGQHWGFTGRFLDEDTGLWYYRARYYDPAAGRFAQRDPIGELAGPNQYSYASSRPTVSVDPLGLLDIYYTGTPPNTHVKLAGIPVWGGNWTWDEIDHWRLSYLEDLITKHEFLHATSMQVDYDSQWTSGARTITITGLGEGPTEAGAKAAAKQDASSKLNLSTRELIERLYAPEHAKDEARAMPAFARLPDVAYTEGLYSNWISVPSVNALWNAHNARADKLGKARHRYAPQAWTSLELRGMHVEESYKCTKGRFLSHVVSIRRGFSGVTCSSNWITYWRCECTLTARLPRRITAVVHYPVAMVDPISR